MAEPQYMISLKVSGHSYIGDLVTLLQYYSRYTLMTNSKGYMKTSHYENDLQLLTKTDDTVDNATTATVSAKALVKKIISNTGRYGPAGNVTFTGYSQTQKINIPYFVVNEQGLITQVTNHTLQITSPCSNCAVYSQCNNCSNCSVYTSCNNCSNCSVYSGCNNCSNCSNCSNCDQCSYCGSDSP